MKIEHVALWTRQLDVMEAFYCRHFGAISSARYHNTAKAFESVFLSFESGARLELMSSPWVTPPEKAPDKVTQGLVHLAFSVGSRDAVHERTEELRASGSVVVGEPRVTGDGYFESVILDPDGNLIEITA